LGALMYYEIGIYFGCNANGNDDQTVATKWSVIPVK